jgi:putative membrane protein
MTLLTSILIAIVALIHIYIVMLEMFWWDQPRGLRAFGLPIEFARQTKALAANQGLYNGFLAAGLIYGILQNSIEFKVFFLICVMVAGIFGALTASRKILWVQTVPATLALVAVWFAR